MSGSATRSLLFTLFYFVVSGSGFMHIVFACRENTFSSGNCKLVMNKFERQKINK